MLLVGRYLHINNTCLYLFQIAQMHYIYWATVVDHRVKDFLDALMSTCSSPYTDFKTIY